jgi:predicted 2-oxoglutarate/Fe(II)-dependent dioxygenase YbiX
MAINLQKGQKIDVGLSKITVGLGWDPNEGTGYDFDLDDSAIMINSNRKLSFSVLLSDPSEYDGGDLLIYEGKGPIVVPKRQGMITFFPSSVLHEVTPVTRGVRRSIVSWIHGPVFC